MASVRLYSYRRCPFAIRVRMTLAEKGVPFETIEEDLANPSAELLKLHPEGLVPLLVHGDLALYESAIITEYLDEAFPGPSLMPHTPVARAQARLWTYWCNRIFKPDLDEFKYENREAATPKLQAHLERLEAALDSQEFLLGRELTLADIHVFPFVRQLSRVAPAYPGLDRYRRTMDWLGKIVARPSFEKIMVPPKRS